MAWWMIVIQMIGLPALKFALKLLEQKYPGLTPVIEMILKYLSGGGSIEALHQEVSKVCTGDFCPSELKH